MEPSSSEEDGNGDFNSSPLIACLTRELAMPTSRRAYEFVSHELTSARSLIMAATTAVIEKPIYSIDAPKKPKSYGDIMLGFDSEFNEAFNLDRTTIRSLVADLKTMPEFKTEDDSAVAKSLCLFAYFLTNHLATLDVIATVFSMKDRDHVVDELVRVAKALQDVSGRVRLRWPLDNETLEIGRRFVRKYRFPDVMGVMGFWIFGDFNEGILFQAVVDDLRMYLDINATEIIDGSPTPTEFYFRTATYSYVTHFLPKEFNILASPAYPDKLPNVVTPFRQRFKGQELSSREKAFNDLVQRCLDILKDTIKYQAQRFPRLFTIDLPPAVAKHIILGSCVLHNASIYYHDMAPF